MVVVNSVDPDQLASQKPVDLGLHCFQNRIYHDGACNGLRTDYTFIIFQNTHQCKDKPRYTLSDILEEPSPDLQVDRQRSKGKKPLRMIATGLIGGIISPITALCMLQSSTISDELEKLLALGNIKLIQE